ncbi:hypothetical protein TNCV_4081341 [Trichonephila clavipes]|nr:hypothetical protein TNCV_4081341 [Trichonephila clavipes]
MVDVPFTACVSPLTEQTVTEAFIFLIMSTLWVLPQLQNDIDNFILQLNGAPPHWSVNVRNNLDEHFPQRWIEEVVDF